MSAFNSKTIRNRIAQLARTEISGKNKTFSVVLDNPEPDLKNKTPALVFQSAQHDRNPEDIQRWMKTCRLDALIMVLDADETTKQTAKMSWDSLDDGEQAFADFINNHNRDAGYWESLEIEKQTEPQPAMIGGRPFIVIVVSLKFKVKDS